MSEYEYSDEESSDEEIRERREQNQRRERTVFALRQVQSQTSERNAERIIHRLGDCGICLGKKIHCFKIEPNTTIVPEALGTAEEKLQHVDEDEEQRERIDTSMDRNKFIIALTYISKRKCLELQCGHSFHWACIYRWIHATFIRNPNVPPKCPICRAIIHESIYTSFGIPSKDAALLALPEFEEYDEEAWNNNLLGGRRR